MRLKEEKERTIMLKHKIEWGLLFAVFATGYFLGLGNGFIWMGS